MIEIERKFTVVGDFMGEVAYSRRIVQGYICDGDGVTVRVRLVGERAFLTIKGPSDENFFSRYEFEREVGALDGAELIRLCRPGIIEKTRHYIPRGKHTWEVDVFGGDNMGLVVAEIELASRDEDFDRPPWIGVEVTAEARYYNVMLAGKPYSEWKDK
ncbi:MAG: CYTH domain-containing protein [Tannerellaceae bacterium]|jgi:CYTH domain-containing protein|nr:CYTH domain-containing protein [Tannerellaceae bacterium]